MKESTSGRTRANGKTKESMMEENIELSVNEDREIAVSEQHCKLW